MPERAGPRRRPGRDSFEEVAPRTNVREMAGWVVNARRAGVAARTTLDFLFDFASGRLLVDLALRA